MRLNNNRFLSLAMMVAISLSSVSFVLALPDEGMYAPGQLAGLSSTLKKKGLKIKPSDIYNPAGGGLTEAVIRLSIGCTAEFVSPDGLILTNHHCGFDALVSASSPGKDLVETGFNAGSRAGEIPANDGANPYSVFITERVDDVTSQIKEGTAGLTGAALADAYKNNIEALTKAEQAKAPAGSMIRIQMLDNG